MKIVKCLLLAAMCIFLFGCGAANGETVTEGTVTETETTKYIVIDAGHGLGDVGAMHEENLGDFTEADINFAIASSLAEMLTARGYEVTMSHDGKEKPHTEYDDGKDTYGPTERADFSNTCNADLFISIHCDSFVQSSDVYGTRLYYASGTPFATKADKRLASTVGSAIDNAFPEAKDVILKPMNDNTAYTVLYKTEATSLLVECGFITNESDAKKLLDTEWQLKFATAIADGVDKYYK